MSQSQIFGETTSNTTKSIYTFANVVTFELMEKLGDDPRFLDCNQADILNLALMVLCGFVKEEKSENVSKTLLSKCLNDFDEFKDFAIFVMNNCRHYNVVYNCTASEMIEKGV